MNPVAKKLPQTEVKEIKDKSLKSYVIKVTPVNGKPIHIPVIDVRDGPEQRKNAIAMLKESNKTKPSKYMKPTDSFMGGNYN